MTLPKKTKKYKIKKHKETEQDNNIETKKQGMWDRLGNSPRRTRTPEEKRENKKLAIFLVCWIIPVVSVYFALVQLEIKAVLPVYLILGIAFLGVWFVLNGGFGRADFTKYEKPPEIG